MQGRILGMDGAGGIILASDGARHSFTRAAWKGSREPVAGEQVDFEPSPDGAQGIYPLRSSLSVDLGSLGARAQQSIELGAASPAAAEALTLLRTDPRVQLSLLILLACLFLNLVVLGGPAGELMRAALPGGGRFSLVNIGQALDLADRGAAAATRGMDMVNRFSGGASALFGADSPYAAGEAAHGRKAREALDSIKVGAVLLKLAYSLYLVPICAVALLVQAWRRRPTGLIALALGGLCVLSFLEVLIAKAQLPSMLEGVSGGIASASELADLISPGLGAYVLLAAGLTLIAVALGVVKAPWAPARPQPGRA